MSAARFALASPLCAWLALSAPGALAQEAGTPGTPPDASVNGAAPTPGAAPAPAQAASLTLERAVSLAAERNEVALAAQQRAQAAEARVARARAFFFPELTATGTYTRRPNQTTRNVGGEEVILQRYNAFGANIVARATLFDARGFPLYRAAKLEGEAAGLDAVEARRQVAFEAANAFLVSLADQQVFQAAEQRLAFARQSLEDAQARAKAGLASTNDVTRAELEVASAEVQLTNARNTAQTSRLELGYLLVEPVEGGLAPPDALLTDAARPLSVYEALAQGAADRRPDILSTRLRVESLKANAKEPLARLLPALGASYTYRLTNEAGLTGRTGDGFFSVDLTWQLFDGGERYAERRERVALSKAAALEEQASTRRVDVDIQRARVGLENAQAALTQSELAVRAARQNAEEQGILYRQGLSTALTVADASLRLFEAEVSQAQSRYALGVALLGLRAAVGLDPLGKEP
ncbi:TolC family protein [Pyxidicoccus fallax]|uniref:TolC family protein n=1 Tax=Pyxidicoccus fallax TaxID=394095 RepID=A0A848LBM2_9BACT|nr:TolC family protein [Pyxidicoccus fallax]NMO13701.1 TolC family protein [Pyxidicoccus fallax]NPC82163.1 TolC family protein [Pyxidicoccus fallax]